MDPANFGPLSVRILHIQRIGDRVKAKTSAIGTETGHASEGGGGDSAINNIILSTLIVDYCTSQHGGVVSRAR